MLRLVLVSLVLLVLVVPWRAGAAPQGETSTTVSPIYWWLGLDPSPFGGKNYNFDEVQRGEHIKQGKGEVRLKKEKEGAVQQRGVKKISKRDADFEDEYYSDEYEYEYDSEESEYEQGEEYYYYDEEEREGFPFQLLEEEEEDGGVISFNDIETECPAGTICVETFFCAEFSGNSKSDQIVNEKTIPILSKIIFHSSPV